ncbi:uncharacterized protein [Centruroides vittatus]|uniref:uncharacterized protein n=1 Tax=Centruroides vittatus TaxID=120091 RepID=UPI00350E9CA4
MAFMMPVVKNEYDIYGSRRSSTCSNQTRSRCPTRSSSVTASLSCSPGSDLDYRLASVSMGCSRHSRNGSGCQSEIPSPKSASSVSLQKFHNRLLDKLKKKLKIKDDDSSDDEGQKMASR